MNSMVSHVHGRGGLPPLSTSKDLTRRDSLSSSRTRDSGYNSDLEFSCSPLDYIDSDQHVFLAPLPSLPDTLIRSNSSLIKPLRACSTVSSPPRSHFISSCPGVEISSPSHLQTKGSILRTSQPAEEQLSSNQDGEIEKWIKENLPSHGRPDKRVSSIVSLSSATSCEMYSDTDMSEDEHKIHVEPPQPALTQATMKTIDIIMRKIEVNLRYAAYMQCNGGKSSNTSTSNNTSTSQQGSRKASQSSGKRKSRSSDYNITPPNDDQDDNAPNKRRRGSQATISSSELVTRFACPFYKHDPSRFRSRRTCPGPGWLTVHRMKEHLYRAHCQSIYCPRCYGTFDAESDLANHLRSAQCSVNEPQPIEGIDRETLKVLRKRSPAFRLEEDKWRDVYLLLFPEVEGEDVPSPFYDADSPTENSRRFRRDLLRRIQLELVNTAQRLPGPVEQRLLHQVAGIIRRCEHELLNSVDSSSAPNLAPPAWYGAGDGRRASGASTISTGSMQQPTPPNGTPAHVPAYSFNPRGTVGMQPPPSTTHMPSGGEHGGHSRGMLSPDEQQQLRNFSWSPSGDGAGNGSGAQDLLSYWLDLDAFPGGDADDTACYGGGLGEYALQMPMGRGQI